MSYTATPPQTGCPATMAIRRADEVFTPAPDHIATGRIMVQSLLTSGQEGELTALRASMDAGVITHWHSHPKGQFIFVLDGKGVVQSEGGSVMEIFPGDSVWIAPHERHWHGASPEQSFSYFSIQAVADGTTVHWLQPVELV